MKLKIYGWFHGNGATYFIPTLAYIASSPFSYTTLRFTFLNFSVEVHAE